MQGHHWILVSITISHQSIITKVSQHMPSEKRSVSKLTLKEGSRRYVYTHRTNGNLTSNCKFKWNRNNCDDILISKPIKSWPSNATFYTKTLSTDKRRILELI